MEKGGAFQEKVDLQRGKQDLVGSHVLCSDRENCKELSHTEEVKRRRSAAWDSRRFMHKMGKEKSWPAVEGGVKRQPYREKKKDGHASG